MLHIRVIFNIAHLDTKNFNTLSGGEKQKVLIGYGIIAIPTGIVTAEVVASKNEETKAEPECLNCNTKVAAKQNFCHNCGFSLK